jgi:hypothetical protein
MKVNHQVEISRWDTFVRDNGPVLHMLRASHQVLVHLAMQFQRRFLEIDQPETRIAYYSRIC